MGRNMGDRVIGDGARSRLGVVAGAALLMALPPVAHAVDLAAVCQANKLKAVSKQAGDALDCYSKAALAGGPVDTACVSATQGPLAAAFTRAESRGGCLTNGDAGSVTTTVTSLESNLASSLRPTLATSRCASAKLASVGKRARYLLASYAKQRKAPKALALLGNVDTFVNHLDGDFANTESTGTDCLTTGDAEAVRTGVMTFAADVLEPVWPMTAIGLRLTHATDWMLCPSQFVVTGGSTIELTNFACNFDEGGATPSGGAIITVVRIPLPTQSLADFIASELNDAENLVTETVSVGGASGTKATYTETYDGFASRTIALFVPHGATLFKFYLAYGSGEPAENQFVSSFAALLASVSFVN